MSGILSIARGALEGTLKRHGQEKEEEDRQRQISIENERLERERVNAARQAEADARATARERANMENEGFRFGVSPAIAAASSAVNELEPPVAPARTRNGISFPTAGPSAGGAAPAPGADASGISYHRELSPAGQKEAAQRAAHARLMAADPTAVGPEFDPEADYTAEEKKLSSFTALETALRAAGYSEGDARLMARHNIDLEERRTRAAERDAIARARRNAEARANEDQAFQREDRATNEARGLAQLMAEDGHDARTIAAELAAAYPNMKPGMRASIATLAVQQKGELASEIDARTRTGRGRAPTMGISLPDGSTLEVPAPGRGGMAPSESTGTGSSVEVAQQRRGYDAAAAQLRSQGKSGADIVRIIGKRP